jgi:CubicO group peptidase (beta-lactamase class C family)
MKKILSVFLAVASAISFSACSKTEDTAALKGEEADELPGSSWQNEVAFPDWAEYVDDTLAMNSMFSFKDYEGQGDIYVTVADDVESYKMYVNDEEVDTSEMVKKGIYKVDISSVAKNGTNTLQVSNIEPSDAEKAVTVDIPYPTVIDGDLKSSGLNEDAVDTISSIVQSDVDNGFTSAQMAVIKDGQLVYQNAWGTVDAYNQDGTAKDDSAEATNDTLYDLASNTKMYAVNYALQYLVTNEKIDLDTKITDIIGDNFVNDTVEIAYADNDNPSLEINKVWKSELTIRDILRHQAGFPADPQYHNDAFNQETQKAETGTENVLYSGSDGTEATREKTLESICETPLMYEPGTKTVYSDVDFMLLGFIIEKTTGEDLNTFLKETFWDPMGLTNITYNPLQNGFDKDDCAATELNGNTRDGAVNFTGVRTDTIQGEVHDEKAYYAMGGMSGHAGLFSNATDLAKLASVMLTGGYGNNSFFSTDVMDTFTAPKKEDASNWGLGWWREADNERVWYFGTQSSSDTIGHQGWTGTLTMIDPSRNLVVVYLTNKINSPVTDPETSANTFDGNWYTSATLGFVPQILSIGMDSDADTSSELSALLADMVNEKFKLISEEETAPTADHPIVKAAYSLIEVLFDRAETTKSDEDRQYAENAMKLLDEDRDAAEIKSLKKRITW